MDGAAIERNTMWSDVRNRLRAGFKAPVTFQTSWLVTCCFLLWGVGFLQGGLGMDAGTLLFGQSVLPSIGVALIAASVVHGFNHLLIRSRIEPLVRLMFALAILASLYYVHVSYNRAYTNDVREHLDYVFYIRQNWLSPFGYSGRVFWHPPLYYYAAAAWIWLSELLTMLPLVTSLRFFSWLCYCVFLLFGLRSLQVLLPHKAGFRLAALVLLFWPGGMHVACKLSNEPMYYALYAAGFYYAVLWYQKGVMPALPLALCVASLSMITRCNGFILFLVIGFLLLCTMLRGRFQWRRQKLAPWLAALVVMTAAGLIATMRMWTGPMRILEADGLNFFGRQHPAYNYVTVHLFDLVAAPINRMQTTQSFWDYFIRTSLFGEYGDWNRPWLASGVMAGLLLLVLYTILPWLRLKRIDGRGMLPVAAGLVIPIACVMAYSHYKGFLISQDARFIYPYIVCFAALAGRSHDLYVSRGWNKLALGGMGLAALFALLSLVYFFGHVRGYAGA